MSMAIRRLCDHHKDSISLWKLINDIHSNSAAVKRSWFLRAWPDGEEESLFLEFFGDAKELKANVIARHLENLQAMTKAIRERADKFEAHKDKKQQLEVEPNFNDINKAVEVVCDLYLKYYYLLMQKSLNI